MDRSSIISIQQAAGFRKQIIHQLNDFRIYKLGKLFLIDRIIKEIFTIFIKLSLNADINNCIDLLMMKTRAYAAPASLR